MSAGDHNQGEGSVLCDACNDTGRVMWGPFQQRYEDTHDQPCPDCAHFRGEVSS